MHQRELNRVQLNSCCGGVFWLVPYRGDLVSFVVLAVAAEESAVVVAAGSEALLQAASNDRPARPAASSEIFMYVFVYLFLSSSTYFTICLAFSLESVSCAVMGTEPQTPEPPLIILSASILMVASSAVYLLATSR